MKNFIGGMKLYHVWCSKCDWKEDITVQNKFNEPAGLLSKLFGLKNPFNPIPNKCPKCNSKTEKYENKDVCF